MTTREQDCAVEELALKHGRVAVREGFEGGVIHAAIPSGQGFQIDVNGSVAREGTGLNFSVKWEL